MNTATNTVVLVRNVLTRQIVAALASTPAKLEANTVTEEATVYGPTAFNRFIHNGRYLAKDVVAQVWDVLTTGEAVDCPNKSAKRIHPSKKSSPVGEYGLTQASLRLFIAYAKDAGNWSNMPLVGGNVGGSKQDAGNLTDLKKKGLVTTAEDDGCEWISFTAEGKALADKLGCSINPAYSV